MEKVVEEEVCKELNQKQNEENIAIEQNQMIDIGDKQSLSKLPIDISFDILSRLPLKTISLCRWVCKFWYDLVLHPRFAKIHFDRAIKNSPCVLFRDYLRDFYLIDYQVFDNYELSTNVYKVIPKKCKEVFGDQGFMLYHLLGSVNGLACFCPEYDGMFCPKPFYVWNPITGEYVVTPYAYDNHIKPKACGFGFDSINRVYKVIQISKIKPTSTIKSKGSSKFLAQVCTVGSDSWRVINNVPDFFYTKPSNVFVNGNLHWKSMVDDELTLVSFNVSTEEFSVTRFPPCFKNGNDSMDRFIVKDLGVLRERLCFVDYDNCIWVMSEYGVHNSWVKEYDFEGMRWSWGHDMIQLNNGEFVLLYDDKHIGYYDCKRKNFRVGNERHMDYYDLKIQNFRPVVINNLEQISLDHIWQPILQVGSLFSPKTDGIIDKEVLL